MKKLTNYTPGPRGVTMKDGGVVWIKPGASVDVNADDIATMPDLGQKPKAESDADDEALKSALTESEALRARVAELEAQLAGKDSGSKLPGLTGKSKAELLDIAKAEGVEIEDGATNNDIVAAIELHREG